MRAIQALSFAVLTGVLAAGASPAAAQQSQTITIVVGFGAGGLYHNTGMLLSRHMGQHLPGNPTIVVKAQPGAGSIIAANYIANVAPKDGSVLGIIGGGTILEALYGNKQAQYDPRTLRWIGSMSTAINLCTVWHEHPVKTIADAAKHEVIAGSTGRGSRTTDYPIALNNLTGAKFKVVSGYTGLPQMHPAMERRELHSICGWGWDGIMAQRPDWLADKKVNILVQFGARKHPQLPDVPLLRDLARTEDEKLATDLLVLDTFVAWPLIAPPGTSDAKVAELRAAFVKTLAEPGMIEETKKVRRSLELVSGEEIEQKIAEAYKTPPHVRALARKLTGLD
jgi:tripartite-type tricarboxylate transporter receptor subunit TctC